MPMSRVEAAGGAPACPAEQRGAESGWGPAPAGAKAPNTPRRR